MQRGLAGHFVLRERASAGHRYAYQLGSETRHLPDPRLALAA